MSVMPELSQIWPNLKTPIWTESDWIQQFRNKCPFATQLISFRLEHIIIFITDSCVQFYTLIWAICGVFLAFSLIYNTMPDFATSNPNISFGIVCPFFI